MKHALQFAAIALLAIVLPCCKKSSKEENPGAPKTAPFVTLTILKDVTASGATASSEVNSDGGATLTARGFCWGLKANPTLADSISVNGAEVGKYSGTLKYLSPGKQYYIRAYATNSVGTTYGLQETFTTSTSTPVVTTIAPSGITAISATSGGVINDGGIAITSRGVCWGTAPGVSTANSKSSDGPGGGSFTSVMTGLSPGTKYYVRAYAAVGGGIASAHYGSELSFNTPESAPVLTTTAVSPVLSTTAVSGGNITAGGNITSRGIVWSIETNPNTGDFQKSAGSGSGSFTVQMTNLAPNTKYYVRAYAVNSAGTSYGPQQSFTTTPTVTDVDGNVYQTVVIGKQTWMAENLRTTKYRNGQPIGTTASINTDITAHVLPQYYWAPNGNSANIPVFGLLYTWFAIKDSREVAPAGWRLPTDADWTELVQYLGPGVVGNKIRETGFTTWGFGNETATNESGFTARGAGGRSVEGEYIVFGRGGYLWSASAHASYWMLGDSNPNLVQKNGLAQYGFSVRCIKN